MLVALFLCLAEIPPVEPFRQNFDFIRMTPDQASIYNGNWVTATVELGWFTFEHDGFTIHEVGDADDGTLRSVWLRSEVTGRVKVSGRFSIIRHEPSTIGGTRFPGFVEMRLVGTPIR